MPLNKSTGNMYDFITHTWNTIKGECPHGCSYCYMKRWGKQPPLHFDEKELKTDLGKNNFIFVGSSCDMFADGVDYFWKEQTLDHCLKYTENKYLLQTKSPDRLFTFLNKMKDNFFICGISDWEVDKIMSLDEVYLLKKAVLELYDGDEYIVKFQLQRYIPVTKIATTYYRFCSKDEVDTIFELTKELDYKSVIDYFFKCGNWVTVFQGFINQGEVLNTPNGFYRKVSF